MGIGGFLPELHRPFGLEIPDPFKTIATDIPMRRGSFLLPIQPSPFLRKLPIAFNAIADALFGGKWICVCYRLHLENN